MTKKNVSSKSVLNDVNVQCIYFKLKHIRPNVGREVFHNLRVLLDLTGTKALLSFLPYFYVFHTSEDHTCATYVHCIWCIATIVVSCRCHKY